MSDIVATEMALERAEEELEGLYALRKAADALAKAAKSVEVSLGDIRWDPTELDFAEDHCQEVDKLAAALAAYEKVRGIK